jgi:hypothetical protein
MRPSTARPGDHLVFVDIQLRPVGPQFVDKQRCECVLLLVVLRGSLLRGPPGSRSFPQCGSELRPVHRGGASEIACKRGLVEKALDARSRATQKRGPAPLLSYRLNPSVGPREQPVHMEDS